MEQPQESPRRRPRLTPEQLAAVERAGPKATPATLGLVEATAAQRAGLDGAARRDLPLLRRLRRRGVRCRPASGGRPAARATRRTHTTRGSPDDDPGGDDPEPLARRAARGGCSRARHRQPLPDWFARRYGDLSPHEQLTTYLSLSAPDAQAFAHHILDSLEAARTAEIGTVCGLNSVGTVVANYVVDLVRSAA